MDRPFIILFLPRLFINVPAFLYLISHPILLFLLLPGVKEISSSVQTLETLTPDLLTSLVGVTSDPVDGGQAKLLRVMVKRWHLEVKI